MRCESLITPKILDVTDSWEVGQVSDEDGEVQSAYLIYEHMLSACTRCRSRALCRSLQVAQPCKALTGFWTKCVCVFVCDVVT